MGKSLPIDVAGVAVDRPVLVPAWRGAGELFHTRERIALAWVAAVTHVARNGIPDADYETAATGFSEKELADLTYAIGLMNAFNRFGNAFRATPAATEVGVPDRLPRAGRSQPGQWTCRSMRPCSVPISRRDTP